MRFKRLGAAVLSAVMMLTAVATPLGDNLPAVRDSVSVTASADTYWVGSSKYGYYANNSTALNEVKAIMSKNCSSSEIARFNKILSEFPLSGYFNLYKTKACTWHCSTCNSWDELIAKGCRSSFYDDETGKTVPCSMTDWHNAIQCAGYAVYCYYRFMGKTTADIITLPKGFTADQLKRVFSDKNIRTGAHFRKLPGHSLCYLTRDDNYIYFIDANSGYNSATGCGSKDSKGHYQTCCKINLHKYTYKEFASACSSGKLTIYNSSTSKFDGISTDDLKKTPSNIGSDFESVIKCTSTGKVLSAGSDNNVTAVSYNGSNNQLWKFYKNSDNYYEIVNVGTGKRLDVSNAGTANGTNIQVWTDNDSSAQRWGVYGSQGSYLLKPKYSTSSVLDSGGGNNNVHLWAYANNIAAQKFTIEKMPSTWFSDVTAKNIKTNDARITLLANKPASAKATKYSIEVWQTNNSSNKKSYSFTPSGNYPNEGVESKQIYFDMIAEVGFTLSSATQYSYKITQYFNYLGASMSRTSGTYSFTTLASSTHIHSYGSWYTKTAATCTSGGVEEHKCSCGKTETRSTSALGHNFGTTYFEAAHPHKYAHLCQRCGYKEFTGGNLAIYEKCDICYNENLPGKPSLNISSNGFNETDNVSFTWNDTEKTTHYVLTVAVLSGDEYKTVCRETYVNSGFQTTFGKGQYRALLQSYNSNMFHQYTSDWRDWVHNNSEYVYFNIDCAHEYLGEVVSPTFDREGYTQYTCTKCGDSYIDNYTAKLTLPKVTNFKVKSLTSTNVTLQWTKNSAASGYEIEQYKGGKWTNVAKVTSNATTSYTVKGLKAGTAGYQFRIRAYRNENSGKVYSGYSSTVKVNTNPYGVGGFKCSSKTSTSVTLKWNKGTTASGYQLQQYKGGKWVTIYTANKATVTSYTVKNLKAGTAGYRFRIRAYKTYGNTKQYGSWSSEVKVNTNPYGVGGFKVKATTKTSITLGWNKGTTASGYQLQQYKGGKWVTVYTGTKATSTSYTVKSLKANTSYKFRIRAYKTYGNTKQYGSWSKVLTVKTKR